MEKVRLQSLAAAERLNYPVHRDLPLLEADLHLRAREDVIGRTLALHAVVAYSHGLPLKETDDWLGQEGLHALVSQNESRMLVGDTPYRPYQYQVETIWVLAWALSWEPKLDFSKQCDDTFVHRLPDLWKCQSSASWRDAAVLRSQDKVISVCDLAYCLHWGARQLQLEGRRPPLPITCIVERRRALEWLLTDEQWDTLTLDT